MKPHAALVGCLWNLIDTTHIPLLWGGGRRRSASSHLTQTGKNPNICHYHLGRIWWSSKMVPPSRRVTWQHCWTHKCVFFLSQLNCCWDSAVKKHLQARETSICTRCLVSHKGKDRNDHKSISGRRLNKYGESTQQSRRPASSLYSTPYKSSRDGQILLKSTEGGW